MSRGGVRSAVAFLAVLVLGVGGFIAYTTLRDTAQPRITETVCIATVRGRSVELDQEQSENAALIAAISVSRGLPARAASIALATAIQESKIYNLDVGDRDSLGIFQQRPSQGWGTRAQIMDPVDATNAFYDALVRVDGYESMPITDAAQRVQHSGFPQAYATHESDARVLASALTGNSPHAFTCEVAAGTRRRLSLSGIYRSVTTVFGASSLQPGVDPVRGWAVAEYLVAHAGRWGLASVAFGGRRWSAAHSDAGWATDTSPVGSHSRVRMTLIAG